MKKQIVNKETREVLMTISLKSSCPKHWAQKIQSYIFDCEIELVDVTETVEVQMTFWQKVKSWFSWG